jgi:hypothetical protein
MSSHELKQLLDQVADTREIVLRRTRRTAEYDAWSDAHEEAEHAYLRWRADSSAETYTAYRAAQDREDAAQDTLALAQGGSDPLTRVS